MSYPDLEEVITGLLVDADIAVHTGTGETPPTNLRYRMPFCLVARRGGPDDGWTDQAVVFIDWFSSVPGVAKDKSNDTRDYLTQTSPLLLGPIDRVQVVAGPQEIPHGDTSVLRWTTTYEVHARRIADS